MVYSEWEKAVPHSIKDDPLWSVRAYRIALFLGDLAWSDATKLASDRRTISTSDQLYRAVGAISADISEGYSRITGKDRSRFYSYALGSARESRDWYYRARHILSEKVTEHRMQMLVHVIKLLLTMIPEQRGDSVQDEAAEYGVKEFLTTELPGIEALLHDIPVSRVS